MADRHGPEHLEPSSAKVQFSKNIPYFLIIAVVTLVFDWGGAWMKKGDENLSTIDRVARLEKTTNDLIAQLKEANNDRMSRVEETSKNRDDALNKRVDNGFDGANKRMDAADRRDDVRNDSLHELDARLRLVESVARFNASNASNASNAARR